eukprot:1570780-Rhodomonas_salina.1
MSIPDTTRRIPRKLASVPTIAYLSTTHGLGSKHLIPASVLATAYLSTTQHLGDSNLILTSVLHVSYAGRVATSCQPLHPHASRALSSTAPPPGTKKSQYRISVPLQVLYLSSVTQYPSAPQHPVLHSRAYRASVPVVSQYSTGTVTQYPAGTISQYSIGTTSQYSTSHSKDRGNAT